MPSNTEPQFPLEEKVPREKLKEYTRERSLDVLGGTISEDLEDGEGGSDDPFDRAPIECYAQPEILSYAGTVDWEIIFEKAGIAEWNRPTWRKYVQGEDVRNIPEAHYRFILRACREDPWQCRIRRAIEQQRTIDAQFGVARPTWNNRDEKHRRLTHFGWHPVGQSSVATVARVVSSSPTRYRKADDFQPSDWLSARLPEEQAWNRWGPPDGTPTINMLGPVPRPGCLTSQKARNVRRAFVGCDGFRANFQGARLEEYRACGPSYRDAIRTADLLPIRPLGAVISPSAKPAEPTLHPVALPMAGGIDTTTLKHRRAALDLQCQRRWGYGHYQRLLIFATVMLGRNVRSDLELTRCEVERLIHKLSQIKDL